jgi:hypothetical protein
MKTKKKKNKKIIKDKCPYDCQMDEFLNCPKFIRNPDGCAGCKFYVSTLFR